MMTHRRHRRTPRLAPLPLALLGVACLGGAALVGCDQSTGGGQGTIYGKSRDMGRDVRDQIQGRDAEAGELADELTGNN